MGQSSITTSEGVAAAPIIDLSCRSLKELPSTLRGTQPPDAAAIRELNLAFNSLTSLLGLVEACPALERLVVSHNKLRSLPHLGSLLCLGRLDLSHNRLTDISALSGCTSIQELWLASNSLELPAIMPLGSLGNLRDLVLHGNPCLNISPTGLAKRAVLLLLPGLASLDAQPISANARADAASFMHASGARAALNDQLGAKQALALLRSGPAKYAASGTGGGSRAHEVGGHNKGKGNYCPPRRRRLGGAGGGGSSCYTGSVYGSESSYGGGGSCYSGSPTHNSLPAFGTSSPTNRYPQSPTAATPPAAAASALFDVSEGGGGGGNDAASESTAPSPARSMPGVGSPGSVHSKSGNSLYGAGSIAGGSSVGSLHKRRNSRQHAAQNAVAAGEPVRAAALCQAQNRVAESERALAAAMAGALPPEPEVRKAGPPKGVRYGRRSSDAGAPSSSNPSIPASESEWTVFYPKSAGGTNACVMRADGSAIIKYPSGTIAVSVEVEPNSAMGFRLNANYRLGGRIALSFDGAGNGFAYHPDGKLLISHQAKKGGMLYGKDQEVKKTWGDDGGGGERLCVPVGDCMALLFTPPSDLGTPPTISLAFRCDGFEQLVHHGKNAQRIQWEGSLNSQPVIANMNGSSRAAAQRRTVQRGTALPPRMAQAGGPRQGLSGIADALALLPDLNGPRKPGR